MTLQIHDVEQGSDEWLELRRGMLTASVIGQFITPKTVKVAANDKTRAMQYQLVSERITGVVEDRYVSREMEAGHFIEPIARAHYSEHYARVVEMGFMVREEATYKLGYSPDGVIEDSGLIEIKLHLPKLHVAIILADEIPAEHMAQCQAGLFVSGREWIDYISYSPGLPMWVKSIEPDLQWQAAIVEAATSFETSTTRMVNDYYEMTAGLPPTERVNLYQEIEIF